MNNSRDFSAPHFRSGSSELWVALDLLIAALPAIIWSAVVYGARPILTVAASMLCAAFFEALYAMIFKDSSRIPTAATLGMILALFMPAGVNYLFIPLAALISVTLRRFTGGIVSPIAGALLPLFLLSTSMSAHAPIFENIKLGTLEAAGNAETLLDSLSSGIVSDEVALLDAILGKTPECIGGMSMILLIFACAYLLFRRAIPWQIPIGFVGGAAVIWFLLLFDGAHYDYVFYHLTAGGAMLCAVFGATEYSSAPVTPVGRFIHGAGCGILTMLFRKIGLYAESVLLSMLIMSLFSRIIDMVTAERYFGYNGKKYIERLKTLIPDIKK